MYSRIDWFLFLRFVCSNYGCHFYNFYHKSPKKNTNEPIIIIIIIISPCPHSLPFWWTSSDGWDHKVHVYLEYHSVCPLPGIGTLSKASECVQPSPPPPPHGPTPNQRRGECTRIASHGGERVVPIRTTGEKSPALCLLCGWDQRICYWKKKKQIHKVVFKQWLKKQKVICSPLSSLQICLREVVHIRG